MKTQTRRSQLAGWRRSAMTVAAVLGFAASAQAQTTPNVVEFLPSAHHTAKLASGAAAITRYEFLVYPAGAVDPYLRLDLGKPAPQADGVIRLDFTGTLAVWPLPNVASEARVAAIGPDGVSVSVPSGAFTYTCTGSAAVSAQAFAAAGGNGTAQVTAGARCGWTAMSSASWLAVATPSGIGAANVAYTVAANTGAERTATLTIGDKAFVITQGAAGTTTPPAGKTTTYLSDLTWSAMTNGWGPAEKDRSNGENAAGSDGKVLTLNGKTYSKGLGVHAASDIRYPLAAVCTRFDAEVGVDDEVGSYGSVVFQVFADGVKLFDSGAMTGSSATKVVSVDLSGRSQLQLVVADSGNGLGYDHGDWADARITCGGATTPTEDPAFVEAGGVVVAEIERFDSTVSRSGYAWAAQTTPAGFAGTAAMQVAEKGALIDAAYATTSPELRYRVRFSAPGTYYVWLRGYAGNANNNAVHVGLNGQAITTADRMSLPTFNAWTWFKSTSDGPVATITVPTAGVHTVNLWMREDGLYLDRLLLTTSSSLVPSGAGPAESARQ